MKTANLIFAAILFALPAGVVAQGWTPKQEKRLSRTYDECGKASGGNMPAMFECADVEFDKQDAKLNQAYRMVMARLPAVRRAALRSSQRTWIRTRDTNCQRAWDEAGGGQASELERRSCMLHETIARTMRLERYR